MNLKVDRARHHLDDLDHRIAHFERSKPYRIDRTLLQDGLTESFTFHPTERPPEDLSAILGDFVHNCRSALDHIAWAIWLEAGGDPQNRSVVFPLMDEEAAFPGRALPRNQIPVEVLDEIERVQPYHDDYRSMGWLRHLSNIDKHQNIHLAYHQLASAGTFAQGQLISSTAGPLRLGSEILRFRWRDRPDTTFGFQFRIELAFGAGPVAGRAVGVVAGDIFARLLDVRDRLFTFTAQ